MDRLGIEYAFAYSSLLDLSPVPPQVNADGCHNTRTHRAAPGDKIGVCVAGRRGIDPICPVPLETT